MINIKRKTIIIAIVIGLFVGAISMYKFKVLDMGGGSSNSIQEIIEMNKSELEKVSENITENTSRSKILSTMHEMANSLIVADTIWGEIEVTEEKIIEVMAQVSNSTTINDREKERLLIILQKWKTEDYSSAVKDHNYLWGKLGGNVGKAKDLRGEYKN